MLCSNGDHHWIDGKCAKCGALKVKESASVRNAEELESLRNNPTADAAPAKKSRSGKKKEPPPPLSPEQQEALHAQRKALAEMIARAPHQIQESIAEMMYGYRGDAFQLTESETNQLALSWLS